MSALGLQDIIKTVSIIICIGPTGLRLRHIGKTDPQCGIVRFCFRSGRFTCSARTGSRAVTTPLVASYSTSDSKITKCSCQKRVIVSSVLCYTCFHWRCLLLAVSVYVTVWCLSVCLSRRSIAAATCWCCFAAVRARLCGNILSTYQYFKPKFFRFLSVHCFS